MLKYFSQGLKKVLEKLNTKANTNSGGTIIYRLTLNEAKMTMKQFIYLAGSKEGYELI